MAEISYIRREWVNNKTKLNADNMNHIENGIEAATVENPVILKFNKVTGYTLPISVVLDGIADDGYTWAVSSDGTVGTITIIAPTGNITGTIAGVATPASLYVGEDIIIPQIIRN